MGMFDWRKYIPGEISLLHYTRKTLVKTIPVNIYCFSGQYRSIVIVLGGCLRLELNPSSIRWLPEAGIENFENELLTLLSNWTGNGGILYVVMVLLPSSSDACFVYTATVFFAVDTLTSKLPCRCCWLIS